MQVNGFSDIFSAILNKAPAAAGSATEGSLADTLIKAGTATVQGYSQLQQYKLAVKAQKAGRGSDVPYDTQYPANYPSGGYSRGSNPMELLGKNGPLILGGLGILTVVAIALKMTGSAPR